jgi:hypothetical protein
LNRLASVLEFTQHTFTSFARRKAGFFGPSARQQLQRMDIEPPQQFPHIFERNQLTEGRATADTFEVAKATQAKRKLSLGL